MREPYRESVSTDTVSRTRIIDRVGAVFAEYMGACAIIGIMTVTTAASCSGYIWAAIFAMLTQAGIATVCLINSDTDIHPRLAAATLWLHIGILAIIDAILYGV